MAALQTTGAISLANVKTVFGGPASQSLGDYYRNGIYIRSYSAGVTQWQSSSTGYFQLLWGGSTIVALSAGWSDTMTTYTTGGYTYYKGDLAFSDSGYGGSGFDYYYVFRVLTTAVTANGTWPVSGPISLKNLYGGEKP